MAHLLTINWDACEAWLTWVRLGRRILPRAKHPTVATGDKYFFSLNWRRNIEGEEIEILFLLRCLPFRAAPSRERKGGCRWCSSASWWTRERWWGPPSRRRGSARDAAAGRALPTWRPLPGSATCPSTGEPGVPSYALSAGRASNLTPTVASTAPEPPYVVAPACHLQEIFNIFLYYLLRHFVSVIFLFICSGFGEIVFFLFYVTKQNK